MRYFLHRNIVLPGFETVWKRRRTFQYLSELERSQWYDRDTLEKMQLAALKQLLKHAFQNSTYFRSAWQERGLRPDELESLADFRHYPLIDRSEIKAHRVAMRAATPGMKLLSKSTGGSTGVPLQFDLNPDSSDRRAAAAYRAYGWAGAGPGTKQIHLWGVPLGKRTRRQNWKDGFYHGFLNRRRFLSTFGLAAGSFDEYFSTLNRYRPDAIVAYTNSLYEFARMIDERKVKPFTPKSIVVGAEKLHDFQRALIEKVFQVPVFETYGSREFMLMAAECDRHDGLHVTQEYLLVEILDEDGSPTPDGEEGDVVVTDLYNYGMPFIRYRNGDRAIAGSHTCPCGRGLPLLKRVTGRRVDIIRTPDGRRISGVFFPHLLKDYPAVKRFQVVQEMPDRVEMSITVGSEWTAASRDDIEGQIRAHLGPQVQFELKVVENIPLTASGKLTPVINKCTARDVQAGHAVNADRM